MKYFVVILLISILLIYPSVVLANECQGGTETVGQLKGSMTTDRENEYQLDSVINKQEPKTLSADAGGTLNNDALLEENSFNKNLDDFIEDNPVEVISRKAVSGEETSEFISEIIERNTAEAATINQPYEIGYKQNKLPLAGTVLENALYILSGICFGTGGLLFFFTLRNQMTR